MLQLPFGKGQRWATSGSGSWFLGGWQLSPTISILSGVPFTVTSGGALNATGSSQTADLVGKFRILNGKPPRTGATCAQTDLSCHYFDPSAFAAPPICTNPDPTKCPAGVTPPHYGNTNRNEFRGPGYFTMNLSLAPANSG